MLVANALGFFDYAVVGAFVGVFVLRVVVHIHRLDPGAIPPHRCVFVVSIPGHTMVLRSWTILWRVIGPVRRTECPDAGFPRPIPCGHAWGSLYPTRRIPAEGTSTTHRSRSRVRGTAYMPHHRLRVRHPDVFKAVSRHWRIT
jgi:hypothetical protein